MVSGVGDYFRWLKLVVVVTEWLCVEVLISVFVQVRYRSVKARRSAKKGERDLQKKGGKPR